VYRSALEQHLSTGAKDDGLKRWRPRDTVKLARVIDKLAPYKLREKYERILLSPDLERSYIHEALGLIYAHADWLELRAMLVQLGERRHAALVPVLIELVRETQSPFTRLIVVQACERIGHSAVEPLLLVLVGEGEDLGVRFASLRALGAVGTPRAVRSIGAFTEERQIASEAKRAMERILARYPDVALAPAGALSVVEDSVKGALELAQVGEGELELYEASERAARRKRKKKKTRAMQAKAESPGALEFAWHSMPTAPRLVPWPVWLEALGWGRQGESQVGWALVGIWGAWLTQSAWPLALGLVLVLVGLVRSVEALRTWRSGVPSFARLVRHDLPKGPEPGIDAVEEHTYVFEYLGLDGKPYRLERKRPAPRETWQVGARVLEPMLYLPGPDDDEDHERATLAREMISTLVLAQDGSWHASPRVVVMMGFIPVSALALALLRLVF